MKTKCLNLIRDCKGFSQNMHKMPHALMCNICACKAAIYVSIWVDIY